MEIKHVPEQSIDQRRNQEINQKNILRQMKKKTYQNFCVTTKAVLRGKLKVIISMLRNEKYFK